MKIGEKVFEIHLEKVKTLLKAANYQDNPAAFLFANDLRTPMFMLQACGRVFSKIYDSTALETLKEDFKQLEDILGSIDYYTAASKNLGSSIPEKYNVYFTEKAAQKTQLLNQTLSDNSWLNDQKISQIESVLKSVDWENDRKEIKKFYSKTIEKIKEFVEELNFDFTDIEEHVHELRRKLRWLSIYPQALQGIFVFQEREGDLPDYLEKYMTEGVVKSPFNILPTTLQTEKPILLEKGHYLALSWIISELGKIKDAGLQIEIVKEAIIHTENLDEESACHKAGQVLGNPAFTINTAKAKAEEIAKVFFEENILKQILID